MSDTASWGAEQELKKNNPQINQSNYNDQFTISMTKDDLIKISLAAHRANKTLNQYIVDAARNTITNNEQSKQFLTES